MLRLSPRFRCSMSTGQLSPRPSHSATSLCQRRSRTPARSALARAAASLKSRAATLRGCASHGPARLLLGDKNRIRPAMRFRCTARSPVRDMRTFHPTLLHVAMELILCSVDTSIRECNARSYMLVNMLLSQRLFLRFVLRVYSKVGPRPLLPRYGGPGRTGLHT